MQESENDVDIEQLQVNSAGLSISDSWVHLQPSLVQNSVLLLQMRSHFGKIVQTFELKMVRGAPKGHQLTPLDLSKCHSLKLLNFNDVIKSKSKTTIFS